MTTELIEQLDTRLIIPETRVPHITELEAGDVLTPFERQWYGGLELMPQGWPENLRPSGDAFAQLVQDRFKPAFFEIDAVIAERALAYAVLRNLPDRVPQDLFRDGEGAITRFCLDVIPVVETAYPEARTSYPQFLASRVIGANVDAYGTVRDHFSLSPLTHIQRDRLKLSIGEALADREQEEREGPVMLTKKPLELGINPRYTP